MSQQPNLTSDQQKLDAVWNEHLRSEFEAHSADETLATMVENPMVKLVPVMLGGDGKEGVHQFYSRCFLRQIPPDASDRSGLADHRAGTPRRGDCLPVHSHHPDGLVLPGITPTGKRVEMAMLIVVQFDGDKMVHEHIYWHQASVLVQIGLLLPARLPVVGAEGARSVLDRDIPLNALLHRASGAVAASRLPAKRSALGEVFRGLTNQRTRA